MVGSLPNFERGFSQTSASTAFGLCAGTPLGPKSKVLQRAVLGVVALLYLPCNSVRTTSCDLYINVEPTNPLLLVKPPFGFGGRPERGLLLWNRTLDFVFPIYQSSFRKIAVTFLFPCRWAGERSSRLNR